MLSLLCHFNGTIMVVLHVRLHPLCKWFSVQLSPGSGAFHCGISLLVAHFMQPAFFLSFESFRSFVFRFTAWVLGLQFRFRIKFMLRVKFRGYV